ncbi:biliverdin-producing heme oxygenase [Cellvibrio japonicus]|uniref:Heme oxygenase n=1 Tax=Cellvibrio japonicus (strain Ueda107) TaxID=498211 RepID=B3PLR1_CELJU|nr:biliverdin-producing heme oxygenase [Cellvibrio japonicus]ACE85406.1 Heme oxygenase [Cellvibrio japonicus Ueda107]QEI13042.1 biliverdin-producing heme oxygenase [Cellvibrio japonicus]QEI16616.1 biliverdin-producing heme oxygenase [Cellvibrio japonicus]QEI20194.1 biliverdin-producing heme oxygenase [Cellvibrio japonicus]
MSLPLKSAPPPLSALLKETSTGHHEGLDKRIMSLAPFSSRERYALFLRTMARLHRVTTRWFQHHTLKTWLPGLDERDRVNAVLQDCTDLGVSREDQAEDALIAARMVVDNPYTALGWAYTIEGSNMGAAFLLKMARAELGLSETFGARHMAGHDDGRGLHWRRFREALDAIPLTEEQRELAQQGALDAFNFARKSVDDLMADSGQ